MLTTHAKKRMKQRAIPSLIVDAILAYGSIEYHQNGAEIFYLKAEEKKELLNDFPKDSFLIKERLLDVYLVTKGKTIITTGYRTKKLNRH